MSAAPVTGLPTGPVLAGGPSAPGDALDAPTGEPTAEGTQGQDTDRADGLEGAAPAVERFVQIVIMLVIGAAAGAGSFTHVHDVAAAHGQAGWLAWADAVVLELMSIASGLELRRRQRARTSIVFPASVMATSVVLSLGAQVVDAEPSPIGWITAAVPALGFLVMVKIALGHAHRPAQPSAAEAWTIATSGAGPGPKASPARLASDDPVVEQLVPAARSAAMALHDQGRRLTRHGLAEVMRADGHALSNGRASALLLIVKAERDGHRARPVAVPQLSASVPGPGHAAAEAVLTGA